MKTNDARLSIFDPPPITAQSRALPLLPGAAQRYRLGIAFSFAAHTAPPSGTGTFMMRRSRCASSLDHLVGAL